MNLKHDRDYHGLISARRHRLGAKSRRYESSNFRPFLKADQLFADSGDHRSAFLFIKDETPQPAVSSSASPSCSLVLHDGAMATTRQAPFSEPVSKFSNPILGILAGAILTAVL